MLTAYGTVARAVEAMKLGAVDFLEKPFDPKAVLLLCEEILQRQTIGMSGTVDELLHLAELARERKAFVEARVYLKIAMQRDLARPEPYCRALLLYGARCTVDISAGTRCSQALRTRRRDDTSMSKKKTRRNQSRYCRKCRRLDIERSTVSPRERIWLAYKRQNISRLSNIKKPGIDIARYSL
jgi:hypothetical protein